MKTNAIISALCVVGIIGALCSNGEENRSVIDMKGPGKTDDPGTEQNEGLTALPVQKVVYWSDIPGMKWDWGTQVTNAPGFLASESDPTIGWTNGTLYVHGDTIDPVEYQQDGSVRVGRLALGSSQDGCNANAFGSLAVGGSTTINGAFASIATGWATASNQFTFVYGAAAMPGTRLYGDHGTGTFNVNPYNGTEGFWIGETNLATYLANAGSGEHTHSNLVNGTTQVIANQNGTASIVSAQSVQKPNCVRVSRADGTTGKTIVLSFKHTPDEFEQFQESWPSQVEFTITYDGVIYDAVTVGETDEEWGREVSSSLSWANGGTLYPSGYGTFTPGSGWNGVFACSGTPGGVSIIGDDNGEICSTYTYTSETSISKTIATTDQLSEFVDKSVTNGLASTSWVNNALSGKMNTAACIANGDVAVIMSDGNAYDSGSHIGSFSRTNHVHYSITTDEPGLVGGSGATLEINNDGTATVTWHPGSAPPGPGEPVPQPWTKVLAFTNDIQSVPSNVSAFNNDAGYVKTNAQGTLVVGSNQMQPNGGSWSLVMGSGGSHSKSDNTLILSPGSNIGTNSHYSAVFGPGAYIHDNAQYSFAFGGGVNIQDNCNDSFVIGSGAQSAHKCAFLWSANSNGGRNIPAQPITHGNGTFNINTYDGVAGVYIGDTNLQQIIRLEAKAMIHDAVSQVNVNLQSAEDTRVALTNLITILKNL